ncbi:hypothetical protein BN961_02148 [Afipia felis]|uniref:Uncharacterized protein n=1 Tax=Afipia felis TaxID=1035 RepID=A0A090MMV5_AFIFE|nr:hypothetical protein [Afipia felis]CEG08730.1 hypothetical protein BN961_02148 [Afipia felis]
MAPKTINQVLIAFNRKAALPINYQSERFMLLPSVATDLEFLADMRAVFDVPPSDEFKVQPA